MDVDMKIKWRMIPLFRSTIPFEPVVWTYGDCCAALSRFWANTVRDIIKFFFVLRDPYVPFCIAQRRAEAVWSAKRFIYRRSENFYDEGARAVADQVKSICHD
ncbi:hypothetical protein [Sphingomonas abietis]|uniref:Uncharacterized protein n=1 Tax=Sphingomonas abietis TaxID=3012344 RepID=A0ABY7NX52_9SPHN|nr:hypothetical protein [Sphingomonas abietis]WBO23976.1 hypothetical protein PBT88_07655 [Sphingomonas abietis]